MSNERRRRELEVLSAVTGEPTYIARCPVHGLHGERTECFVCGGPVEQVPMRPVRTFRVGRRKLAACVILAPLLIPGAALAVVVGGIGWAAEQLWKGETFR